MRNKYLFLLILLFHFVSVHIYAQQKFKLENLNSERSITFKFGQKMMFQMKASEISKITAINEGKIDSSRGIYELRIMNIGKQDIVFQNNIRVPISAIQWVHLRRTSSTKLLVYGLCFFYVALKFNSFNENFKIVSTGMLAPISIGLILSSGNNIYSMDNWQFQIDN